MEESKNKSEQDASNKGSKLEGFDLNALLNSPYFGELIKHLLSGGGAVVVNYLLSIKPMQEKIETLTNENKELRKRMDELEKSHDELVEQLNKQFKEKEQEELRGAGEEYFSVKKERYAPGSKRRKYLG